MAQHQAGGSGMGSCGPPAFCTLQGETRCMMFPPQSPSGLSSSPKGCERLITVPKQSALGGWRKGSRCGQSGDICRRSQASTNIWPPHASHCVREVFASGPNTDFCLDARRYRRGDEMFTAKESTRLFEMSRRLRELHIRKAAAQSNGDREEIDELQAEIDALTNYCNNVLDADTAV